MSQTLCSDQNNRGDRLVAYVYEEMTGEDRTAFERHLLGCGACRSEIAELTSVRTQLADWTPPVLASLVSRDSVAPPLTSSIEETQRQTTQGRDAGWWSVPVWAQVAAAMLCLGAGAGLANVRITHSPAQWTVTTGWRAPAAAVAPPPAAAPVVTVATRDDLVALEQQLRAELKSARAATAAASLASAQNDGTGDAEMLRRVRALIRESEQRQQRELALRVGEVARDAQAQRQADLVRIDRTLGVLQNNTGLAVRRQEQLLNSLAVRVSQRQE